MSRDKISQYYLLCTIRNGGKQHIFNQVPPADWNLFISKKEVMGYMKQPLPNAPWTAKETIIGGRDRTKTIVI